MTDAASRPTRQDYRRVFALTVVSGVMLAAIACLSLFVPTSRAPRVHIRWSETVNDVTQPGLERQLKLHAGEHIEGRTWAYDLGDPSQTGVAAIVGSQFVEDTHDIERSVPKVSEDAPLGSTRIHGGLSLVKDAPFLPWLTRLLFSLLVVAAIWLATTGRQTLTSSPSVSS